MIKKIALFSIFTLSIFFSAYLVAVYKNNQEISALDVKIYKSQLEKSILWLQNNKQKIVNENNAILWWIIYEAHKISHDPRLSELIHAYFNNHPRIKQSFWGPLFNSPRKLFIDSYSLLNFPYYNQHFVYSLHCTTNLIEDIPIISLQNESNFCSKPKFFYRPACTTHQLMGINFLNLNNCNNIDEIETVITILQQDIVTQLTWDIRVVDVYLQRVMMLLMTGAQSEVKPIWIQQILNHQLADGGWGKFDARLKLWKDQSLGFSSKIVSIQKNKSSFHTTTQGVYLLTWLAYNSK